MRLWVLLSLLLLQEALPHVIGQPAKSKRPKEPGENKIKPVNKKVKPKNPKMKERESVDSSLKSQSILTQVMDKGHFQKLAATLSLAAGQSIELRCKGSNVTWNYPSYLDTFKDSRLSIKQLDRYSQLILANSTAADTGEYSCWLQLCHGNKCRKDETKTGSTYIFFTDKEELFVPTPSYFEIVYLNPDKPAVIPCRVTTPSAKVTLHREFPAEEIETDGTDIFYDAKKGFVFQHPTSDHKGIVYCKAESQGAPQISIKYHLLYVEVPKGPPSATIAVSSSRAGLGDRVHVVCTVLGEPDVDVNFRWQYPGQECWSSGMVLSQPTPLSSWALTYCPISEQKQHINLCLSLVREACDYSKLLEIDKQRNWPYYKTLKECSSVEDFEDTDVGNYICITRNLQGETTVTTKVELK